MMKELLRNITRQDVYNVIVPIAICIIGWLLPLLKSGDGKFAKKWMCDSKKSDCDKYGKYFFVIILMGIPLSLVGILFLMCIAKIAITLFGIVLSINILGKLLSLINGILIVVVMLNLKLDPKQFVVIRLKRFQKAIGYFMCYIPFIYSIWIWGISIQVDSALFNGVMILLLFLFEIMPFIFFDNTKKFEYAYVSLYFANGSEGIYLTDCVKQKGNWIIAKDLTDSCEIRYRREDLVKVKYFNIKNLTGGLNEISEKKSTETSL